MGLPRRRWLIALFVTVTAVCVLVLFLKIGDWLFVADTLPPRLDVVFTFAGENTRITYSRELMERFPAARWVLSDYLHQYSRILSRDGFDMSRVAAMDTSPSTYSEVKGLADWLTSCRAGLPRSSGTRDSSSLQKIPVTPRDGRLHIALVSNPFHMRRIKFMVGDVFHDQTLCFHYLPVPVERYGWTREAVHCWWKSKRLRNWVGSEIGKLLLYWLFS